MSTVARAHDGTGEVLTRTVELLSTAHSLERITEIVAGAVRTVMGADGATFVLRDDGRCYYADENAVSPLWKGSRFPLGSCVSGWAMLNRQSVQIPDIYVDPRVPHDAYRPTFVKSLAMAPIRSADPIGALGAYWSVEHSPGPAQMRLLEVLANSAAVALENLELRSAVVRRGHERDSATARVDELESAVHTIAHDLRSPLGAILGYAELLEDAVDAHDLVSQAFARTITDAGRRMAEQIDRMLSIYRITNRPLEPAPVDLSAMGRELADRFERQVVHREVEISIEDGLHAVADPVLAHLVLENLLGNAVKYTGRTPEARIGLSRAGGDRIGAPDPFATFVVRDNGDGFPADEADRLFRPMTRLHTDAEFPGTGLGLASVARIVELHGGRVRAEGEKSVGASFYFSLPVTG
jgi:signal transduction histidine kinase